VVGRYKTLRHKELHNHITNLKSADTTSIADFISPIHSSLLPSSPSLQAHRYIIMLNSFHASTYQYHFPNYKSLLASQTCADSENKNPYNVHCSKQNQILLQETCSSKHSLTWFTAYDLLGALSVCSNPRYCSQAP